MKSEAQLAATRKWRARNAERVREYNKHYYATVRRATVAVSQAEWRKKHPGAWQAHRAVQEAIWAGVLVRPTICERCKRKSKNKLHAHHADYAKPLEVEWLCQKCHRFEHRERTR